MRYSEICRQLIMLAYDPNPRDVEVAMGDALSLYKMLLEVELLAMEPAEGEKTEEPTTSDMEEGKPEPQMIEGFQSVEAKSISGRGSSEKRRIYRMLLDYRARHGLGCLTEISIAANGVSVDEIRTMMEGGKFDMHKWQKVGAAIDRLEAMENGKEPSQRDSEKRIDL